MNKEIKDLLFDLKGLPKYQFERRIDIFILEHLEDVLSKILIEGDIDEEVHFLYPEFPLRSLKGIKGMPFIDTTKEKIDKLETVETRHNTNVDYLLASKNNFYFVELKTDTKSFKENSQLIYYSHYSGKKFKDLYKFFKKELANPKNHLDEKWQTGFDYLNDKLKGNLNKEIKIIYLGPEAIKDTDEYEELEKQLNDKLIFVSLSDFANEISGDESLKSLLKEIDK